MPETRPQTSALPTPAPADRVDSTPSAQGTRVLLAVSTDDARERRERTLREAGLDVLVARTSFETVVKATCTLPDVILLDPTLGRDVLVETRRLLVTCPSTAHIPVVRLTARRTVPRRLLATFAA